MASHKKFPFLNEVLDVMKGNDVFIEPTDVKDITDDEDENLEEQLSKGELLPPAELLSEEVEVPKKRHKKLPDFTWTTEVWDVNNRIFPQGNYTTYTDLSPVELFELFIDEKIVQRVQKEMTKYCVKKNWIDVKVQISELKVFIAILIVSGYNHLPKKTLYWSKSTNVFNKAISNCMRKDRFDNIMKCLHFSTSDMDTSDKYTLFLICRRNL